MSNPTVAPFDYSAELYMGTNLALLASADFHLEAGESKDISLPVIMPSVSGTYPVYIGVFSSGVSIGLYKAVEDVTITLPAPFTLGGLSYRWVDGPTDVPARSVELDCVISNPFSNTITHQITLWYQAWLTDHWSSVYVLDTFSLTLGPGESHNHHYAFCWWDASRQMRKCNVVFFSGSLKRFWLEDELGNQSVMLVISG